MEKGIYRIKLNKWAESPERDAVKGYLFSTGQYSFGVSNIDRVTGKKCRDWKVTELKTGCIVSAGYSRKEAVKNLFELKKEHTYLGKSKWQCMEEIVNKAVDNLNETIKPKTEILSA